jgi:hypothetical protein
MGDEIKVESRQVGSSLSRIFVMKKVNSDRLIEIYIEELGIWANTRLRIVIS